MKMTIASTTRMVEVNGVRLRVWEGRTANGVEVVALVASVAIRDSEDAAELAGLERHEAPSEAARTAWPDSSTEPSPEPQTGGG